MEGRGGACRALGAGESPPDMAPRCPPLSPQSPRGARRVSLAHPGPVLPSAGRAQGGQAFRRRSSQGRRQKGITFSNYVRFYLLCRVLGHREGRTLEGPQYRSPFLEGVKTPLLRAGVQASPEASARVTMKVAPRATHSPAGTACTLPGNGAWGVLAQEAPARDGGGTRPPPLPPPSGQAPARGAKVLLPP